MPGVTFERASSILAQRKGGARYYERYRFA